MPSVRANPQNQGSRLNGSCRMHNNPLFYNAACLLEEGNKDGSIRVACLPAWQLSQSQWQPSLAAGSVGLLSILATGSGGLDRSNCRWISRSICSRNSMFGRQITAIARRTSSVMLKRTSRSEERRVGKEG